MSYCPKCRTEFPDDSDNCWVCGCTLAQHGGTEASRKEAGDTRVSALWELPFIWGGVLSALLPVALLALLQAAWIPECSSPFPGVAFVVLWWFGFGYLFSCWLRPLRVLLAVTCLSCTLIVLPLPIRDFRDFHRSLLFWLYLLPGSASAVLAITAGVLTGRSRSRSYVALLALAVLGLLTSVLALEPYG